MVSTEPRKKKYFPLNPGCLIGNPYIGLLQSHFINWVVCPPLNGGCFNFHLQGTWPPKIPGPHPVSQSAVQHQGPRWNQWSFESTPPAQTQPNGVKRVGSGSTVGGWEALDGMNHEIRPGWSIGILDHNIIMAYEIIPEYN